MPLATVLTDPEWLRGDLGRAARMYGPATDRVLGTVRWYSISSVLVAPSLDALVHTGTAMDPALEAVTFDMSAQGRVANARSARPFTGDLTEFGTAMRAALAAAVDTIASVSGAKPPALWAIAGDSISNRLLWAGSAAGDAAWGTRLAQPLAEAIGAPLPRPRYTSVGQHTILRRASCCLIYEATGGPKCVSCPNQRPEERDRRLHEQLG